MIPTVEIPQEDIRRLEQTLGLLIAKARIDASKVIRKTVFDLMRDVMRLTPVDTGRARAAWSVWFALNGQTVSVSGPNVKPSAISGGVALGEVKSSLIEPGTFVRGFSHASKADDLFAEITNNVRYIIPLEFGWSKQNRRGMVREAVRRLSWRYLKELKDVL